MNHYLANASVIYTGADGISIDTFVIFDTDPVSGLTHINHHNLKVKLENLQLHPKTVGHYHLPLDDAFSFEILKKLRDKYEEKDMPPSRPIAVLERARRSVLGKAS